MVTQLNFYSNSDVSIIDLMNTADGTFIGKHQVSLTNYDNTSLPAIATGSIVENNGSLFKFEDETAISGSPSDGTVYIYLVPSGDPALGTATVTPTFSNTSPTWSDSKQGWYGTGGSANYRYLEFYIFKSSTNYGKDNFNKDKKTYIRTTLSAAQTVSSSSVTTVLFDTKANDIFYQFNTSNYTFTAKRAGNYLFNIKLRLGNITTESYGLVFYYNGSAEVIEGYSDTIIANDRIQTIVTKQLNAGDTVLIQVDSVSDTSYTINYLGSLWDIIEL